MQYKVRAGVRVKVRATVKIELGLGLGQGLRMGTETNCFIFSTLHVEALRGVKLTTPSTFLALNFCCLTDCQKL